MEEQQPLTRRRFVGDVMALGTGLLASLAWALTSGNAQRIEAGPRASSTPVKPGSTTSPRPSPRPPSEPDYRRPGGVPMPPPTVSPTAKPTPRETNHVPLPGGPPVRPPTPRPSVTPTRRK